MEMINMLYCGRGQLDRLSRMTGLVLALTILLCYVGHTESQDPRIGIHTGDANKQDNPHKRTHKAPKNKHIDREDNLEGFLKLGDIWERAKRSHLSNLGEHSDFAAMHRARLTPLGGYRISDNRSRQKRSDNLGDDEISIYAAIGGASLFFLLVILALICWCSKQSAYRKSSDGKTLIPDDTPAVFSVVKGYENLAYKNEDVVDCHQPDYGQMDHQPQSHCGHDCGQDNNMYVPTINVRDDKQVPEEDVTTV